MAETLEQLQARLQQTNLEFLDKVNLAWDIWLKQYDEVNKQLLASQQETLAKMQDQWRKGAAGCAAVPPAKR